MIHFTFFRTEIDILPGVTFFGKYYLALIQKMTSSMPLNAKKASDGEWPEPPVLPYTSSYAGVWWPPGPTRPPKRKWPTPLEPIVLRSELPPGWDENEPDLFE